MTHEAIFERDELSFPDVDKTWTIEELLSQEGLFSLKDVAAILCISNSVIRSHVESLLADNKNPYEEMGVRKLWGHWMMRMTTFAPYYKAFLFPKCLPVREHWNANVMLRQKGLYRLVEVCKKIPLTYMQLRIKAREDGARERYGMFRDEDAKYLVDMEPFAKWLTEMWRNDFKEKESEE